jgi:tetratricopeptide (TPR) repeat protein
VLKATVFDEKSVTNQKMKSKDSKKASASMPQKSGSKPHPLKKMNSVMSTTSFMDGKSPKAGSQKNPPSPALLQALSQVKDFMTDSQKALILLREGKAYFDNGDYRGALDCFNEGISYNPSVTLFNQRAACHKALEMFSEAYFDYSFNIRIEPDVGIHFCNRGLCLARLKKVQLSLEDMDLAIHYDPSASHYYARATVFGDFGRYEEALAGKDFAELTVSSHFYFFSVNRLFGCSKR